MSRQTFLVRVRWQHGGRVLERTMKAEGDSIRRAISAALLGLLSARTPRAKVPASVRAAHAALTVSAARVKKVADR